MRTRINIPWQGLERLAAFAKQPLMLLLVAGVTSALSVTAGLRSLSATEEDAPVPDAKAGTAVASAPEADGAVTIALGEPNTAANRLSISARNMAPGDRAQRTVDLSIGPVPPGDVLLGTSATTSSILDTDAQYGLQLRIDRCPEPWMMAGSEEGGLSFSCAVEPEVVWASGPVIQPARGVGDALLLGEGAVNYLRTELYLPEEAENDHSGQFSVIRFDFETVPYA